MRPGVLVVCFVLTGLWPGGAAHAAAACQQDDLPVEQGLGAERALVQLPPAALCEALESQGFDCSEPEALSPMVRPRAGRCAVHFGGAPRLHLRPGGRSASPWERMFLAPAPGRLQQAPVPASALRADAALRGGTSGAPGPPPSTVLHLTEEVAPSPRGRLDRIERPPR